MELALEAGDQSFVKDSRGVVEPILPVDLGEPHDCRDAVARQRCQHGFQVRGVNGDGGGSRRIVSETTQQAFRAAQDLHTFGFAPLDSFANEPKGELPGTGRKQRRLIRGDSHWNQVGVGVRPGSDPALTPAHGRIIQLD